MGKYMGKSKVEGAFAVMEVVSNSSLGLGVRTRAKALALQKGNSSSASYLQLRSRRLRKIFTASAASPEKLKVGVAEKAKPKTHRPLAHVPSKNSASVSGTEEESDFPTLESDHDSVAEMRLSDGSFGDNAPAIDEIDRSIRETTPFSQIRAPGIIKTPGSTTRPTISLAPNRRILNDMCRQVPSASELEEFFNDAEKEQQRIFMEKYNYDPVNDCPLPGHYEWVRVEDT